MGGIVIGVDGSDSAARALRWAAREAELHGWELHALLAWGYLSQYHADRTAAFNPDYDAAEALTALAAYVQEALGAERAATVHCTEVCELPAGALLDAGAEADLVVLGARGLGGFKGMLLGSVSQHCLQHATRPTAIVHELATPSDPSASPRIVVGIDGSHTSQQALRWAVEEARVRQATVEVVHAWHLAYVGGYPYTAGSFDPAPFEDAGRQALDEAIAGVDTTGLPGPLHPVLHMGDAAGGILETAEGADLVVVGSRGLGGFTGLLLGSVGHQVANHAPCPVVVIPPGG